jgi:coatomer protein complex subunit alpha (xenin)
MVGAHCAGTNLSPRTLSYNPAENAVLLTSDADGGSYDLYMIPKDANGATVVSFSCLRLINHTCCLGRTGFSCITLQGKVLLHGCVSGMETRSCMCNFLFHFPMPVA